MFDKCIGYDVFNSAPTGLSELDVKQFDFILEILNGRSQAHLGRLQHRFNRLRLLATCSITITNKQDHNAIDYDYIESNLDYNRDYICLQTSSERKKKLHGLM